VVARNHLNVTLYVHCCLVSSLGHLMTPFQPYLL